MTTSPPLPSLVEGYRSGIRHRWDEMLDADGDVRPAWRELSHALDLLGHEGLDVSAAHTARLLDSDGVIYRMPDSAHAQRWQLDPLPVLLTDDEWAGLEQGLTQRAELLDAVLADLYGPRSLLRNALLPAEAVFAHRGFLRQCDGLTRPGGHQLFSVSADLARDAHGQWRVLDDRAATPSGAGYAMENRRIISRVLPGLYRQSRIHRLRPFFQAMRAGLQEVAPLTAEAPNVVLLTSGPASETAYDQAFLSQLLGYPLVSGADLFVSGGRLWLRGLDGAEQVDVVLRRVDSEFCDPVEFRAQSQLGVPGLVQACRLGGVSVVNPLGAGVLENPALQAYLPMLCRALRDEDLALAPAQAWWCGDERSRRYVRDHLDELLLKPLERGGSRSSRFGRELAGAEREQVLARLEAEPWAWVGQEVIEASTVPTLGPARPASVIARQMVLRTFAVSQGGSYHPMAGGLVRVATATGAAAESLLVAGRAGSVAKDVCVLTRAPKPVAVPWLIEGAPTQQRHGALSPRMAQDLFWLGRYTERAESCTRLLRTVGELTGDVAGGQQRDFELCLDAMLQVLTEATTTWPGFTGAGGAVRRADPSAELHVLLTDTDRAGTLAHSVQLLNDAAQAVRDQLSPDTWVVLGALQAARRTLEQEPFAVGAGTDVGDPSHALSVMLSSLLALAGLAAESMVRDLGWHFMQAGRRVERALAVTALLRAALVTERGTAVDALVIEATLAAAESIITYRRRYAARADVANVLALLVLDRDNPRSLAHQLDRLVDSLAHIPHSTEVGQVLASLAEALRSGDLAALAHRVTDGRREDLDSFLGDLHQRLSQLARAMEQAYFAEILPPLPLTGAYA